MVNQKLHLVTNKLLEDAALIVVNRFGLGESKLYDLERRGFVSADGLERNLGLREIPALRDLFC